MGPWNPDSRRNLPADRHGFQHVPNITYSSSCFIKFGMNMDEPHINTDINRLRCFRARTYTSAAWTSKAPRQIATLDLEQVPPVDWNSGQAGGLFQVDMCFYGDLKNQRFGRRLKDHEANIYKHRVIEKMCLFFALLHQSREFDCFDGSFNPSVLKTSWISRNRQHQLATAWRWGTPVETARFFFFSHVVDGFWILWYPCQDMSFCYI